MLTKEQKESLIQSKDFRVTITQELKTANDTTAHTFAMPALSKAIRSFSFTEIVEERDDVVFLDEDEDFNPHQEEPYEPSVHYELTLVYPVSYAVLLEVQEHLPLPDDAELVVVIEYLVQDHPVFKHEFRGIAELRVDQNGSTDYTGFVADSMSVLCTDWRLFVLN